MTEGNSKTNNTIFYFIVLVFVVFIFLYEYYKLTESIINKKIVNNDIKNLPILFQYYIDYQLNENIIRGNISLDMWNTFKKSDPNNLNLIKYIYKQDERVDEILKKYDFKTDNFFDVELYRNKLTDYDNRRTWQNNDALMADLCKFLKNKLLSFYVNPWSRHYQSDKIKEIIEKFIKLSSKQLTYPAPKKIVLPDKGNWYNYAVTLGEFYALYLIIMKIKRIDAQTLDSIIENINFECTDEKNKKRLINEYKNFKITSCTYSKFKSLNGNDKNIVDILLRYMKEYYSHEKDGTIKTFNYKREGSNSLLMSTTWIVNQIFSSSNINTLYIDYGLGSFKNNKLKTEITLNSKPEIKNVVAKYLYNLVKIEYSTDFKKNGICTDGSFVYHENVTAYGYLTSSYLNFLAILNLYGDAQLSNIAYKKYIFSKLEHPKFKNHTNGLFTRTVIKESNFYDMGQLGSFVIHRGGICALKTVDWSLVYRCMRHDIAFYESDPMCFKIYETWTTLRDIIDENSRNKIIIPTIKYSFGVIRPFKLFNYTPCYKTKTATTTTWSTTNNSKSIQVHLNMKNGTKLVGSYQHFIIDKTPSYLDEITDKEFYINNNNYKFLMTELQLTSERGTHFIRNCNITSDYVNENDELTIGIGYASNTQNVIISKDKKYVLFKDYTVYINGFTDIILEEKTIDTRSEDSGGLEKMICVYAKFKQKDSIIVSCMRNSVKSVPEQNELLYHEFNDFKCLLLNDSILYLNSSTNEISEYTQLNLWSFTNKHIKVGKYFTNTSPTSYSFPEYMYIYFTTILSDMKNMIQKVKNNKYINLPNKLKIHLNPNITEIKTNDTTQTQGDYVKISYKEIYPDIAFDQLTEDQRFEEYECGSYECKITCD